MTALAADLNIQTSVDASIRNYPMVAADIIYTGGLVGLNPAGYVKPFEVGDVFVGYAYEHVDNSAGLVGAEYCRVVTEGEFIATLAAVALTDIGKPVYGVDDSLTLTLTGHPDAYVGNITEYISTTTCYVRLRVPFALPPADNSSNLIDINFSTLVHANYDENDGYGYPYLTYTGVGAGLTASTTGFLLDHATGELKLLLDNDNEAENLSVKTAQTFLVSKGCTAEFWGRLSAAGGAATEILVFGLAGLAGGLTSTEEADSAAATALYTRGLFYCLTNDLNIMVTSDNNVTVTAPIDTTYNNILAGPNKHMKVICRPSGALEFWVEGVKCTATGISACSMLTTGVVQGWINLYKGASVGVPEARFTRMRCGGVLA